MGGLGINQGTKFGGAYVPMSYRFHSGFGHRLSTAENLRPQPVNKGDNLFRIVQVCLQARVNLLAKSVAEPKGRTCPQHNIYHHPYYINYY